MVANSRDDDNAITELKVEVDGLTLGGLADFVAAARRAGVDDGVPVGILADDGSSNRTWPHTIVVGDNAPSSIPPLLRGSWHGMTSVSSDDDEDARSGRKRPLWAVPAEEIQSRRDEWLPHLAGKTTAEIHRWAGFEGLPVATAEVWLWAVVHPALDLTCGPDGRWGLGNGPQEVPAQFRSLVERWRASGDPA